MHTGGVKKAVSHARAREFAISASPDLLGALLVLGEDGTIISWNEGAVSLFGYGPDEVVGRSIFETIVPSEHVVAKRAWLGAAIERGSASYEAMRRRKDDVRIWVDVSVRVQRYDDGQRFLILNERDITRNKYQREAQMLQTRFRGVLETGPDAIVLVDCSGRMVLVNSETEQLFGYSREELLGDFVELLVPKRFHKSHPQHRGKYFHNPQTRPMGIGLELWGKRKDGTEFPVEISLSPLTIEDRQLAMAAIRDVSSRKKTEEALKSANAELEAFTYSVSHDLRAPIRQIEGFSKILAEHLGKNADPEVQRYLYRIQEGSQQMGRLVDDLLHLAKLGRQDAERRLVSLNLLVDDVLANVRAEAANREIEWRVAPLPTVLCDAGLIKVVLTNLLSNAVKYTRPRNKAVIEIGQAMQYGQPVIYVRDNGVGFDMKYVAKLFGVFQRLHAAEEFEGTGIGLATVRRIIRKHDGDIWAEAALDKGATFFFTLGAGAPAEGAEEP
ncbi:MAG: sensor histidine kinase [Gemmatimonadaceae bacterium]